jgi:ABC-type transport system involved in cytochrome bd biosynthesis fused ATPase/permease subunit
MVAKGPQPPWKNFLKSTELWAVLPGTLFALALFVKPPAIRTPGVFHFLKSERKEYVLWGGAALALATLNLIPIILVAYDGFYSVSALSADLWFLRALGILVLWALCEAGTALLASAIRYEIRSLLERRVLERLETSPDVVGFAEKRRRVVRDVSTIETWFSDHLPKTFAASVVVLGSLCIWAFLDATNALKATGLLTGWIAYFAVAGGRTFALIRSSKQSALRQSRLFEQVLHGAKAVQSLQSFPYVLRRHEVLHRGRRRAYLLRALKWSTGELVVKVLSLCTGLLVWAWLAESVGGSAVDKQFYVTLWVAFLLSSGWRLRTVFLHAAQMQRSAKRVFLKAEPPPELKVFKSPGELPDRMLWSVEFSGLEVRAGGRHCSLRQSVEIERGSILALVGGSGSGKTMLLEALCGLRVAHWGQLRVEDALQNRWEISNEDFSMPKPLFSYVESTPFLFQGTIRENLTLGNPERLSDMSLWQHLELVGLLPRVKSLGGLGANLPRAFGYFGEAERFRLALVRAMLLERPFLALDDPFTVLDEQSWRKLVPLLELHKEFCGIVIACRQLPTRLKVDQVVHLKDASEAPFLTNPAKGAPETLL